MIVIEKRGLHLPMDEKKTGRGSGLPVLTKEMQEGNINAFRPHSNYSYSSYQEMKNCSRKYKLNTQIHLTKSEPRCKKKIRKEQSHCVGFLDFL